MAAALLHRNENAPSSPSTEVQDQGTGRLPESESRWPHADFMLEQETG
jgi:hypothetical protein